MPQVIKTPDIDFAGFYYPDILRELLLVFRRNRSAMGLTDENEYEVHVQLLRAFALVGHLNNCRTDLVAQEMMIDSLKLLESLKRLLKLIAVKLNSASPAQSELLVKLSEVTTADTTGFIPELSEFTTESVPPISYEILEEGGIDLLRTDRVAYVYGLEAVGSGTGEVSTTAPDNFKRTSGPVFGTSVVGQHLFIAAGLGSNGGEFRVVQRVDNDNVKVVRVPGSGSPGFQTETGLSWTLKAFTDDYASENYTPGLTYQPWTSPVAGDCLFIGHPQCLPGQFDIDVAAAGSGIDGCWEYYDGELSKFPPTSVTNNLDGTLTFNINSLLGSVDRRGADIVVEYVPTGMKERVTSTYSSNNRITTTGLLGQVSPSTDVEDYLIRADWVPFDNQDDGSLDFTQDGAVTFNLPEDQERCWNEYEVNTVEGWWARYRIVAVSGPTSPTIEEISIDQGDQYMLAMVTQGETLGPQTLGGSDGSASQQFSLSETPFLDESEEIDVDETGVGGWVTWTRVDNFLNSTETSRHYMLETDAKDKATITFGDGVNGKIPPAGTNNIRATYRVGGDVDGNVGAGEITANADGVNGIAEVTNPRAAVGWKMKDGGTEQDIERIKRDAPAGLRTRDTASTSSDVERLAVSYTDEDGLHPVARAVAVEEGLGVKTIKLLVVGNGGITLTQDQKEELEAYFNGDRYAAPPVAGKLLMNSELTVYNFEPKVITIQATVVWPGGNAESIRNALLSLFTPLATEDDGVTATWDFGGWVSLSRVYAEIHAVDPAIADVPTLEINGSNASLRLGANELPTSTAANITINIQETAG